MNGVAIRLPQPFVAAVSVLAALALLFALVPAQPAAAEDEQDDAAAGGTDDNGMEFNAPDGEAGIAVTSLVSQFPGQVGAIVENLLGERVPTRRYRGAQRFDTARLIALDAFDQPENAVIARGDLFPDALAGSYLSGQRDAPLLLTSSHRLEPDTLAALEDLNPDRVTLVGGTAAIASDVARDLAGRGYFTERVGGFDRFETAALVATADGATVGQREGHGRTAIVARADEFADALVAGTLSYTGEFPLLLTRGDELHPDTADALAALDIDHVIVPGGAAAVREPVVDEIEAAGIDVERVSGVDRVATSVEFAQFMRDEFGFGLDRINTAIGTRFADALALGPLSGPSGQPIVLTAGPDALGGDGAVQDFLSQTCVIDLAGIGGGHAAISTDLEERIRDIATSTGAPCILDLKPDLALRGLGAVHELTGTLTDNARQPVANEDVIVEVYRATDLQLPLDLDLADLDLGALTEAVGDLPLDQLLGVVENLLGEDGLGLGDLTFGGDPVERFEDTTDDNGEVDVDYTGPSLPAVDIAVACLDHETDECVLLNVGDILNPDSVETDPSLVQDSAIVLWGLDFDLLPNLLLLDPPLAVEESGDDAEHTVTATALSADLDLLDDDLLGLLDLSGLGELGDLLGVLDLLDGLDLAALDGLGTPIPDAEVKFEAYRVDEDLPTDLIDSLVGLLESLGGDNGDDDLLGGLLGVLEGLNVGAVLDILGLSPVATGTEITDENGEADFTYDGHDGLLGLDLVIACYEEDGRDRCTQLLTDDFGLPNDPLVGLAAALWTPAGGLDGLLAGLLDLLGGDLFDLLDLDVLEGLLDAELIEELLDLGLLDEALLDELLDLGLVDEALLDDLLDLGLVDDDLLDVGDLDDLVDLFNQDSTMFMQALNGNLTVQQAEARMYGTSDASVQGEGDVESSVR